MPKGRIIDLNAKSQEIKENEIPAALLYFGERVPVHDWQELFFIAVKCLYTEYPETINALCSTDPTRMLFLRTNTIDMVSPRKIASIIYLETNRTPQQILKAIKLIFNRANAKSIQMRVEVFEPLYPKNFATTVQPPQNQPANFQPQIQTSRRVRNQKPVLHMNQTIEEMLATLDAMETSPSNSRVVLPRTENYIRAESYPKTESYVRTEPQVFGNLFFVLEGKRHGPFENEKNRYVALMQQLAELYPYQILKEAGHHINSAHRLTLMKGTSYLYFREPVELPNNLYIDKDFPDRVLVENERYYLACCGLYFESVMFGA